MTLNQQPIDTTPHALADTAELRALQDSNLTYSLDDFRIRLRQIGPSQEVVEDEEEALSLAVADARRQIRNRAQVLGSAYPFELDGLVLTANAEWTQRPAYTFLLLLTVLMWDGRRTGTALFEHVVADALGAYLGGESLRFGAPRSAPVPPNTKRALTYLARKLGERRSRDIDVRPSDKDMGLDAVAWKDLPDEDPGKVILFGQCATGSGWQSKIGELSLERWRGLIATKVTPVRVFAVPWTLDSQTRNTMQDSGSIVFDRLRIAGVRPELQRRTDVALWCRKHLAES